MANCILEADWKTINQILQGPIADPRDDLDEEEEPAAEWDLGGEG